MKKLLKPACFAFYFLMLLVFFGGGLYYAGWIEAGKNQGLAGGAIVLGWGVMFGGLAFLLSFVIVYFLAIKWVIRLNWILLVVLLVTWGYTYYQFKQRNLPQHDNIESTQPKPATTTKALMITSVPFTATRNAIFRDSKNTMNRMFSSETSAQTRLPIGFFKPNFYNHSTLYFYGNVTPKKGVTQQLPQDSLALGKDDYGDFKLISAPPYLLPEHMNLSFGILYFKALSIGHDFVIIEVNSKTGQVATVPKHTGDLYYWPAFLLRANSISFINNESQTVKIKPIDHASEVPVAFSDMRPLQVKNEWIQVQLKDNAQRTVGTGWIRWQKEGRLLIEYSLPNL
jgi:hypothetical protein